jgi:hypothetical protein
VGLGNGRLAGHSSIWERGDGGAGGRELIRLTTALSEWLQIGGTLCFSRVLVVLPIYVVVRISLDRSRLFPFTISSGWRRRVGQLSPRTQSRADTAGAVAA